ncbi:hypothetical protein LUZ60_002714 [Juncus effusus]|nr:hypothetical protein LUZ60_002714 [Juncus effusus]
MDPDSDVQYFFPEGIRVYKSGRIERLDGTEFVPAGEDPTTGVASKDFTIDESTGLSVRIYLPKDVGPSEKLPVLFFIHGGAFFIHTAGSPVYHRYANIFASKANVLVVSVTYQLAPEHPVPIAYDDTWQALKWVVSICQSGPDTWLSKHGDLNRIFLAGDSAGANIAHNIAVRFGSEGLDNCPKIVGLLLMNPYFWGKNRIRNETNIVDSNQQAWMEETWSLICGGKYEMDHPFVNPIESPDLGMKLGCERVMVNVAELDLFCERGKAYTEVLKKSGWKGEVELYETKGEPHVYFLTQFDSEKAQKEMDAMIKFINGE